MTKTQKNLKIANEVATEIETAQKTYDVAQLLIDNGNVKSKVIRYLKSEGKTTAEITKLMKTVFPNFLYQHARNVLNQVVKKDQ